MPLNLQQAEFVRSAAGPRDFPRDSLPQVVFAGRSNVGKSSVINRLLNRKNFAPPVDARLFLVVHRNQAGFSPFSTAFWHGHSFGNENRLFLILKFIFK